MKTRIAKTRASTSQPVEVTIMVTGFKDVLGADPSHRGCDSAYTMKLGKKDPRAVIKGDNIHIKPPGGTILFTIASSARDKNGYYPVGIAFVREGEGSSHDEHRLGLLNFPQHQVRAEKLSLSINDSYSDEEPNVRHKFSVIIQRSSDGKLGIIDPGIVHEPN